MKSLKEKDIKFLISLGIELKELTQYSIMKKDAESITIYHKRSKKSMDIRR